MKMYKWMAAILAVLILMAFVPACDNGGDDDPVTVTAPSGLTSSDITETSVTISWTDNSNNEDGFSLEMKVGTGGTYAEVADLDADIEQASITGLDNANVYYFRVIAYKADATSGVSAELMVELLQGSQSSFSFVPTETEHTVAESETYYSFHDIPLTNNLDAENILLLEFINDDEIPESWSSSMCIGDQCFSPSVRSKVDTLDASAVHDIDIDIFPGDAGTVTFWFKVSKVDDPADCDSVSFTLTKEGPQSSFAFEPTETEHTVTETETYYSFHDIPLTNNLDSENVLVLEFINDDEIPESWSSSMCIGDQCFSPSVRSKIDTIDANAVHEIDIDIFPGEAGTVTFWFKVSKADDPADCDSVAFTLTKEAPPSSFLFEPTETEHTIANSESYYSFHDIPLTNNLDSENILVLEYINDDEIPADWSSSMCIGDQCYSPMVRTRNDTLAASAVHEIDIDIFPGSAGTATFWFKVSKLDNPADCDSVAFTLTREE